MQRFNPDPAQRLSLYGIQRDLLSQGAVVFDKSISWDDLGAPFEVKLIKTSNVDEIKSLIGIPNDFFEKGEISAPDTAEIESTDPSRLTPALIQQAAESYIFGNSTNLQSYKSAIEEFVGEVTLQVAAGETLILKERLTISGTDPKILDYEEIIFIEDGQIFNEGVLTINAGILNNQETS